MVARGRATSRAARGDPAVWLMSLALIVCVVMIVVLVGVIAAQGFRTFWPAPIDRVSTNAGETFLGVPIEQESYAPLATERREIEARREAGTLPPGSLDAEGNAIRRHYRVGNRDIGQDPFRWVPVHTIASVERPAEALFVEREAWGVWLGTLEAVVLVDDLGADADVLGERAVRTPIGPGIATRATERNATGATVVERSRVPIASLTTPFGTLLDQAHERHRTIERIVEERLGSINADLERLRLDLRALELTAARRGDAPAPTGLLVWLPAVMVMGGLVAVGVVIRRGAGPERLGRKRMALCCWVAAAPVLLFVMLEHPWARAPITPERLAEARAAAEERRQELTRRYREADAERLELQAEDSRWRAVITEPRTGRFAPRSLTEPTEPLPISSIVRIVAPNDLSAGGKAGVYLDRWVEYLTAEPRAENTEGGVYPVIFGTVFLTLLLTAIVVPLGVIAAIYIREYARQGIVISIIRIAINNLAGVPSIVYGVFGLGFFCYTVGRYIDVGPEAPIAAADGVLSFWPLAIIATLVAVSGVALGLLVPPPPGTGRRSRLGSLSAVTLWLVIATLLVVLVAKTPYFHGLFAHKAPAPTFGSRGMLWAALTLALLTLPVVIVATEEAIAAVPRSMREGSYGCGATTWQTIRRIVLPGAMPGILTGAILAMARGAGEVAPLMLVGIAKQVSALPVDDQFPFIHADRSFMHLGFHIYDLGLQSPDSQAARPLVWTTTLLLLSLVLAMNLVAILLRARLRSRSVASA